MNQGLRAFAATVLACLPLVAGCRGTSTQTSIHASFAPATLDAWTRDAIWNDGRAEKCVYEATRTIYGIERRYLAIAYTNKEHVDPKTTCKSDAVDGLEVFKHHWSELVPTEKYDYRFSTMSYHAVATGLPFKLTVSTQEDCGASFKECWKSGETHVWWDSVYFPGAGRRAGRLPDDRKFEFTDALPIALRLRLPQPAGAEFELALVPPQKDTHQASWDLVTRRVRSTGRSTQELPIGRIEADGFEVLDENGTVLERYWFAADEAAPRLRAMVRYEGPGGVTYRLKSHERTAYWKR